MHYSTFLVPIVALLSAASPAVARPAGAAGGVWMCTGSNWSDRCAWMDAKAAHHCMSMQVLIGSIGPDAGGYCKLYGPGGCNSASEIWNIDSPGMWSNIPAFTYIECYTY